MDTPQFWSYVAGFMDGEGCIEIHPAEVGMRIRIANTHLPALEYIRDGVGFGSVQHYRRSAKFRQLYAYAISNMTDCKRFLEKVRPFLIVKAARADYAMQIIGRAEERMADLDKRNASILEQVLAGRKQSDIAAEFGISQALVSRIKSGHTWPGEIARFNARRGLKKNIRPKDAVFRLHGDPMTSPCSQHEESFPLSSE